MNARNWVCLACVLLMTVGTFLGCTANKELKDASLVFPYLDEGQGGGLQYEAAPLKEGTAVLGLHDAAFWVKDGVAYTVNDAAKQAAPDLPPAPKDVTFEDLVKAVKGGG